MSEFTLPPVHELFLMQAKADRVLRLVAIKTLEKADITMTEWLALAVIAAGSKDGLRMMQIAQELNVTLPQVTALVSSLLDKRLCKQHVFADDRRGRQVVASLRGKRLLIKLDNSITKAVKAHLTDIDSLELEQYVKVSQKLGESTKQDIS